MRFAFDLETDGLLDEVTLIHCINMIDLDSGAELRFNDHGTGDGILGDGIGLLEKADEIVGHNIIGFDNRVLDKLFGFKPQGRVSDTLVWSAVVYPNLREIDTSLIRKGKLTDEFVRGGHTGRHRLAAWGYRLGDYKGDFNPKDYLDDEGNHHTWATIPYSKDMDDYCMQDVRVTKLLYEKMVAANFSQESLDLESAVKAVIDRQERRGFTFDSVACEVLVKELMVRRVELEQACATVFPPWKAKGSVLVPKRDNKKLGYKAGVPVQKWKDMVFNPNSRDHIADRLTAVYGWAPTEFTDGGKPKVDETVLASLPYPEARQLSEYLMVSKRLGQMAEGKEAWLKAVKADGRIHGRVNTNGCVTGRMSHYGPNVAQVPKVGTPYGAECRALFGPAEGYVLVGCDAEGIELRLLAHFMAKYDGGAYGEAVVNGKKEDGTDAHSVNQRAIGLNSRDAAKTFVYALIYGAGDFKLGTIVVEDFDEEKQARFYKAYPPGHARDKAYSRLGRGRRASLMAGLPALAKLTEAVKKAAKARGYLLGLDGRRLPVRSQHSALNTLLQSGGAVVMKKALVILDEELSKHLVPGDDYEFVANVHDEYQLEVKPEEARHVGGTAADAIRRAGLFYKLRCPLAGDFCVGANWRDTH